MAGRRIRASLVLTVVLVSFANAPDARASTTWIWPGSAPCDTTLQACVTNAASGDTVLVAQSGAIAESINIVGKSLTLSAQTGFQPTLTGASIQNSSAGVTVTITVSGIGFAHSVLVSLSQGTGNVVTLDHISAVSSGADPGVYATPSVESTINVLHSTFTEGGFYPAIELTSPVSHADLTYNVIGNFVSGLGEPDSPTGIYLSATDAGMLKVNADNNAIWDIQGSAGTTSAGLYLYARDSAGADFNVVGNTINKVAHDGIKVDDQQNAPGHFSLDLFDNIIAGTTESAVDLTAFDPATLIVRGGHNDFARNGQPNHTLGHSLGTNLSVPPRFVSPATGNLALQSSSPVIDEGVTCSPGGVAGPDAAGKNRRFGPSVDIGAYEFGAGNPGLVQLGTSGPDTLTGGTGNDITCGYGGDDTLFGKDGNDFLDGGHGSDRLHGGSGHDRLSGGLGNDLLCARDGSRGDHLDGGLGTDSFRADPGDVKVSVERPGNCMIAGP